MSAGEFKLDSSCAAQARLRQTLRNSECEQLSQAAGSAPIDLLQEGTQHLDQMHHSIL